MTRADRWKNLALLAASLLFFGIFAELALRMFWRNGQFALRTYQSAPYLFETPYWKAWHYPNANVHFVKDCLDINYSTNSFGMRGRQVDPNREAIALLGDSFVEGYAVNDNETISSQLQPLLNSRYQVLNFGVSGGFGTVHEVALYHNYVRHFKPAWVVLFFVNYNDLYDNVNATGEGLIDSRLELTYPVASGFGEIRQALARQGGGNAATRAENQLYLFRLISRSFRTIGNSVQYWWNMRAGFSTALINVYSEPEPEPLKRGWIVTQKSLARLKTLTDETGSRLVVVDLADPYQIDANWLRIAALRAGGKTIDARHPNRRLGKICADLQVSYYDMYDEFMSYIREHRLRFPYLSHSCDRHYTREGNLLVATLLARHLNRLSR